MLQSRRRFGASDLARLALLLSAALLGPLSASRDRAYVRTANHTWVERLAALAEREAGAQLPDPEPRAAPAIVASKEADERSTPEAQGILLPSGAPCRRIGGCSDVRRPARVSRVRASAPVVRGALPAEVVRRVVYQPFAAVRGCHQSALRQRPELAGQAALSLVVTRSGRASHVTVASHLPAGVQRCIRNAYRAVSFPASPDGITTVRVGLQLSSVSGFRGT